MIGKIIEICNPEEDCFTVRIKMNEEYTWKAGQFTRVTVPGKTEEFRIFSIASAIEEGEILFGTRSRGERISDFKKVFLNLKPGDEVEVSNPMGKFTVRDQQSPLVLYASGVGVTPIRGILELIKNDTTRPIEIVYASNGYYLFGEEIKEIAQKNPVANLYLTRSRDDTTAKLHELAQKYMNTAYYYTSGAPVVIKCVETDYEEIGIQRDRLISDSFTGYKD